MGRLRWSFSCKYHTKHQVIFVFLQTKGLIREKSHTLVLFSLDKYHGHVCHVVVHIGCYSCAGCMCAVLIVPSGPHCCRSCAGCAPWAVLFVPGPQCCRRLFVRCVFSVCCAGDSWPGHDRNGDPQDAQRKTPRHRLRLLRGGGAGGWNCRLHQASPTRG